MSDDTTGRTARSQAQVLAATRPKRASPNPAGEVSPTACSRANRSTAPGLSCNSKLIIQSAELCRRRDDHCVLSILARPDAGS